MAVSDNTIVIGAYNDDGTFADTGSAYVFTRNGTTWTQQQKLTAGDGTASDEFGNAVAIQGDVIAVGAHFADLPSNAASGSVYLFQRSGTAWTPTQKLIPIPGPFPVPAGFVQKPFVNYSPILGDHFGESIAMNSGRMAVGASTSDLPATSAGAVYVFAEAGGTYALQQKLVIPDGTNGDIFGCSVALDGTTLIGGAREDSPVIGKSAYGAAYVFEFSGGLWNPQGKLMAADGATADRFGWSVAVSKDVVAIGAREDDTTVGPDAGSVYVFVRSGSAWTQQQKLAPTDTFNGDRFGAGLAFESRHPIGRRRRGEGAHGSEWSRCCVHFRNIDQPRSRRGSTTMATAKRICRCSGLQTASGGTSKALTKSCATRLSVHRLTSPCPPTTTAMEKPTSRLFVHPQVSGSCFAVRIKRPIPFHLECRATFLFRQTSTATARRTSRCFESRRAPGTSIKSSGGTQITQWGAAGDIPVPADYDGDGKSDLAVFRPADGSWWLNRSTAGVFTTTFGVGTDKPVPADFTGDGKTDIAVWRPGNGSWYVLRSEDSSFFAVAFGANGDTPVPADYDGDGKADHAVFRPDGANWYVQGSTAGILIQQFGQAGDKPTPAAFIP